MLTLEAPTDESRIIKLAAVKEIIALRGEIAELMRENARLREQVSIFVDLADGRA